MIKYRDRVASQASPSSLISDGPGRRRDWLARLEREKDTLI